MNREAFSLNEPATHPRRSDWIVCLFMLPCFTAIGSLAPILAFYFLNVFSATERWPWWGVAAALAGGAIFAIWFVRRTINRQCWRLTESELLGGWNDNVRLPLSSMEKIIVGLPAECLFRGMDKLLPPGMRQVFLEKKARSLLLKFHDGSMLPLSLHHLPHGDDLTDLLISRLRDRVVQNYPYSVQETRWLRRADTNALLRKV